tara:strand:- start:9 stop:845 length:837 start_codon:yes stop_codon:yes gene_type:complete
MKLALIQLTVENDINENFTKVKKLLNEAITNKPDFILLPECFLFLSNNKDEIIKNALPLDSIYMHYFKQFAKENRVLLLLGSLATRNNDKIYNCSFLVNDEGVVISSYNKIHMFDVKLKNGEHYNESETFNTGEDISLVKLKEQILGHSICYDLRFPKLYRVLAKNGANLIVAPSAFTLSTGIKHWHTLVKARAIENGVFMIAPNQWGTNRNNRSTYGHSLVVDPWGDVIADGLQGEKVIFCEINLKNCHDAQTSIPTLNHDKNFEEKIDKKFNIIIN